MTTIGMFDGNGLMQEIDKMGTQWRDEQTERELAEWDHDNK